MFICQEDKAKNWNSQSPVSEHSNFVFDEATSALDNETEFEIVKAIENLKNVKTILVIAHRHSTIAYCDRIIELKRGEVSRIFNTVQKI